MSELWHDVLGFEGLYQISNFGRVKSKRGKILKPYLQNGYLRIGLYKNQEIKGIYIHRLVITAFIPKVEGKNIINHKDGNKLNNYVENLEWCNYSENIEHAYKHKLRTISNRAGEKSLHRKLTFKDIEYIRQNWDYNSRELADKFNVTTTHIRRIIKNECWRV